MDGMSEGHMTKMVPNELRRVENKATGTSKVVGWREKDMEGGIIVAELWEGHEN